MTTRRLTRAYAVADLKHMDVDPAPMDTEASGMSTNYMAPEAEISGGDTEPDIPVKKRGHPVGSKNKPKPAQAPELVTVDTGAPQENPPDTEQMVTRSGRPIRQNQRTTEDVKAADARREQLQQELKELNEQNVQTLAEMNAQEELEDEENLRTSMGDDDDADFRDSGKELKGPDLDFVADGEGSREEVEQAPKNAPAKQNARTKRAAKGETRQAVEMMTKAIKSKRKATAAASESISAAKKQKATFPSSLNHSWMKNAAGKVSGFTNAQKPFPQILDPALSFECGGLTDDDAFGVAPPEAPVELPGKNHKPECINDFIELSSCEEEEPASRRLRTKPSLNSGKKPATTTGTAASSPNTHLGSSKKTAKLLIPERVKHCEPSVLSSRNEEVTISATASNDSDVSTFSQAGWKTCFIPTLNHCLASASNPWDIGSGVDIIVVIQGIIDKVYPDSGYRVKFGDKIYLKAKDRLNDRRTLTSLQAIKIVDNHFVQAEFVDDPRVIARYAQWAIRLDGPMVWQIPTPMECTVDSSSPNYVKPKNIFESSFMITLLTPFMRSYQGSCYDYGNPEGAVPLAAAALHRAFSMYKTGVRVEAQQFSRENVGEMLTVYSTNSQRLTDRRWMQIMISYGVESNENQRMNFDEQLDEQQFRDLYVPSSP